MSKGKTIKKATSKPRKAAAAEPAPFGAPLKVPAWMMDPGASFALAETAAVASRALLELCALLRQHGVSPEP